IADPIEGLRPRGGRDDLVALRGQQRFEEPDVPGHVVDDEDPSTAAHSRRLRSRRANARTCPANSLTLIGFSRYPSNPAPSRRSRSPIMADEVTATIGIRAVRGSARRKDSASGPSRSGSRMSMRMTSGPYSPADRIPAAPV